MSHRIALGTVQFGMDYGIANQSGQVKKSEANEILKYAYSQGLDTLDTAIAYGESENNLGDIGVKHWHIISKLPSTSLNSIDVNKWVSNSVDDSLNKLGVSRLKGLLLHDSQQLLGENGEDLYQSLKSLKELELVNKIGVSIYSPDELSLIINKYKIDLVQSPFNVFDRRLESSGWLSHLHDLGIEIHTRSVFMQGLLLLEKYNRPEKFNRWNSHWQLWHQWLNDQNLTPVQACLGFVLSHSKIDRVVIGVDTLSHLKEILACRLEHFEEVPKELISNDLDLINPSRWRYL